MMNSYSTSTNSTSNEISTLFFTVEKKMDRVVLVWTNRQLYWTISLLIGVGVILMGEGGGGGSFHILPLTSNYDFYQQRPSSFYPGPSSSSRSSSSSSASPLLACQNNGGAQQSQYQDQDQDRSSSMLVALKKPWKEEEEEEEEQEKTVLLSSSSSSSSLQYYFKQHFTPLVLLDIAILVLGRGLIPPVRTARWLLLLKNSTITSSALLQLPLPRRLLPLPSKLVKTSSLLLCRITKVAKQTILNITKTIRKLYKNRSKYSVLSDYTWHMGNNKNSKNTVNKEQQQVQ